MNEKKKLTNDENMPLHRTCFGNGQNTERNSGNHSRHRKKLWENGKPRVNGTCLKAHQQLPPERLLKICIKSARPE